MINLIIYLFQLTEQAIKDYNRGRIYLSDTATREGVPVYENIGDALQHAIQIVQSPRWLSTTLVLFNIWSCNLHKHMHIYIDLHKQNLIV